MLTAPPFASVTDAARSEHRVPRLAMRGGLASAASALTALLLCASCAAFEDTREPPPPACPEDEPALSAVENPEVRVEARYPRAALRSGINGFVCLNFSVSAAGLVSDVCVADAMPEDLFNRSAGEALSQWRFAPSESGFRSGTCILFDVR